MKGAAIHDWREAEVAARCSSAYLDGMALLLREAGEPYAGQIALAHDLARAVTTWRVVAAGIARVFGSPVAPPIREPDARALDEVRAEAVVLAARLADVAASAGFANRAPGLPEALALQSEGVERLAQALALLVELAGGVEHGAASDTGPFDGRTTARKVAAFARDLSAALQHDGDDGEGMVEVVALLLSLSVALLGAARASLAAAMDALAPEPGDGIAVLAGSADLAECRRLLAGLRDEPDEEGTT